jgi:hypothetical protein
MSELARERSDLQAATARLEAAPHGHEPRFPTWPMGMSDEETSAEVDHANAWILETNRTPSWEEVGQGWRTGFLRLLELPGSFPDADLGRQQWRARTQSRLGLIGSVAARVTEPISERRTTALNRW